MVNKRKRYRTPTFSSDAIEPPSPSAPIQEHSTPRRTRVKQMKRDGKGPMEIKEETKVPKTSQYRIFETGTHRPGRDRKGRPSKIDEDTVQKMIKALEGHYNRRVWTWDELRRQFKIDCTWQTVKNVMNDHGYHKCRACQKSWISGPQAKTRKDFVKDKQNWADWQWIQIHWSDECHFHQNSRHTDWVIRNNLERDCPDCLQKRRRTAASQFYVWAMIAVGYKSPLIFYGFTTERDIEQKNGKVRTEQYMEGGPMTQERYAREILPIVHRRMQYLADQGKHMVFQEDNDGSHGTRSAENLPRQRKIEMELDFIEDWPPNSPDLNPIETVWRILKSRVKLHHSMSFQELRKAIEEEWDRIEQWEIDEAILGHHITSEKERRRQRRRHVKKDYHMCNRMRQCYERNGLSTEF